MSDLHNFCSAARAKQRKLLAIYLTFGYPNPSWTQPLAESIFRAGADLVELGIPFSDPIADGPVIQAASTQALQAGATLDMLFETAAQIAKGGHVLLMGYCNSILSGDSHRFLERACNSHISGLIIPDMLLGEETDFWNAATRAHLPIIPFLAPTTSAERCTVINRVHAPFVYAVSLTGVTGERAELPADVTTYLARSRNLIEAPLLVGFGIAGAASAAELAAHCDGVIVGSAIIRRIAAAADCANACRGVEQLVRELRTALDEL